MVFWKVRVAFECTIALKFQVEDSSLSSLLSQPKMRFSISAPKPPRQETSAPCSKM